MGNARILESSVWTRKGKTLREKRAHIITTFRSEGQSERAGRFVLVDYMWVLAGYFEMGKRAEWCAGMGEVGAGGFGFLSWKRQNETGYELIYFVSFN